MQRVNIKFTQTVTDDFFRQLKKEVYDYFKVNNISMFANDKMIWKTIFFIGLFLTTYVLIVFCVFSPTIKLVLCAIHGVSIAGIGFNISHDCGHNAYFKNKKFNKLLGYSMDLVGSNSYMWDIKHNKAHHIYTNIDSFDEDITGSYLLRLSPHSPFHKVNRFQFLYAWFLYFFVYFFIVWVYNFIQFSASKFGPFYDSKHPVCEWVKLLMWKAFYLLYVVVLPLWILECGILGFLTGYALISGTAGFILGVTFYLAHIVENTFEFPLPSNGRINKSWARHQCETTSNFAISNPFVTWFCGGLNFQVEHHLFPEICSIHYETISPIVQRVAAQYDVPYNQYSSVCSAIKAHYSMLKKFSSPQSPLA